VQIAALQALTNLSVTSAYYKQLIPIADSVVNVIADSTDAKLTLQSLRFFVNLSLSGGFVNRMLKEKVSHSNLIDSYDVMCCKNVIVNYLE